MTAVGARVVGGLGNVDVGRGRVVILAEVRGALQLLIVANVLSDLDWVIDTLCNRDLVLESHQCGRAYRVCKPSMNWPPHKPLRRRHRSNHLSHSLTRRSFQHAAQLDRLFVIVRQ